jgi:hypothetical protein
MQTFNNFSEIAATPSQNSVRATSSAVNTASGNQDGISELLSTTVKDIVQFKGLALMCPNYTPVAKFEMSDDVLRLKQVTLVDPNRSEPTGNRPKDA